MSQEEVLAVAECGPYKSFSNGDLETFSGVFDGKEENFQFFFSEKRLRRIGVYLYEGQDPKVGAKVWLALHGTMTRFFGPRRRRVIFRLPPVRRPPLRSRPRRWKWLRVLARLKWRHWLSQRTKPYSQATCGVR